MPTAKNEINQGKYPSAFYRVSLKAVIRDHKGNVLLNKERTSDTWDLPGGGWDHGETEHEALARELKEELGYTGKFMSRLLSTATFWVESKQAWVLWLVYDVKPEHFGFTVGEDSTEIGFIDPKVLQEATSFEEQWIFESL